MRDFHVLGQLGTAQETMYRASPGEYTMSTTIKGRPKLVCNGYAYGHQVRNELKNDFDKTKHWRCVEKRIHCKAKLIMLSDKSLIIKGEHNHFPKSVLQDKKTTSSSDVIVSKFGLVFSEEDLFHYAQS
ncbi:UNVERIFIED_CONTAM: hypothetical protein PYX00_001512 [Menopon gallinae]|uniref:FLYWCH-type domain-containing protein n=1 Tax=Menopon gallinae TaxID=328185 RepID=A0AAW2ICM3_9NEOP